MQKSSLHTEKIEIPKEQIEFTGGVGGHTVQGQTRTTRMPDSPEKSTGDSKYLFSSSMTLILRLRESPPGCIMARYSRSLPAGDHLDPLLVLELVLQPVEDDLNDLVPVRLVLEQSADT